MGEANSPRFPGYAYFVSLLAVISAYFRRLILRILAVGPVPKHVAIIMDGNRRYADRYGIGRSRGHLFGYDRLINTLENCLDLGVEYVTVYAFSIDNFARPKDEVNSLMCLMEEKLDHLVKKDRLLKDFGVRVQMLGDLTLLPANVRAAAERAMVATEANRSVVLNICVAYTSTTEIVHSIQEMRDSFLMAAGDIKTPSVAYPLISQKPLQMERVTCKSEYGSELSTKDFLSQDDGFKHRREDLSPGKFTEENAHRDHWHPHLEIWGKQDADATLVPMHTGNVREMYDEMPVPDLRNHGNGVTSKPTKPENVEAGVELQSRLMADCRCAHEADSSETVSGRSDVFEGRREPCGLAAITAEEIECHLYTAGCPPPDILIRTSGETRLSNFMLWQCSFSRLVFCKVLWPQFGLRHFVWVILDYQRAFPALQKQRILVEQVQASKYL